MEGFIEMKKLFVLILCLMYLTLILSSCKCICNSCEDFHYKSRVMIYHGFYAGQSGTVVGKVQGSPSLYVDIGVGDSSNSRVAVRCYDMNK